MTRPRSAPSGYGSSCASSPGRALDGLTRNFNGAFSPEVACIAVEGVPSIPGLVWDERWKIERITHSRDSGGRVEGNPDRLETGRTGGPVAEGFSAHGERIGKGLVRLCAPWRLARGCAAVNVIEYLR